MAPWSAKGAELNGKSLEQGDGAAIEDEEKLAKLCSCWQWMRVYRPALAAIFLIMARTNLRSLSFKLVA